MLTHLISCLIIYNLIEINEKLNYLLCYAFTFVRLAKI